MRFPDIFIWGAAAVSYQIEGSGKKGERGLCIRDAFCRLLRITHLCINGLKR